MKYLFLTFLLLLSCRVSIAADTPGDFDYYVLAITWLPSFCQGRNEAACRADTDHFVVHGLWPQREKGWPEYCEAGSQHSDVRAIDKSQDLFSSKHAAFHEWRKHGTCSGLDLAAYFDLTQKAFSGLNFIETTAFLKTNNRLNWRNIKAIVRKDNPRLPEDAIYVSMKKSAVDEIRFCFTKALQPRACSKPR